ncbi:hypothetical protein BOX15_Mlig007692g2, partial [Macrostomum lignano]
FVAMKSIPVQHRDLIHDVAYDSYGKRLATCSSDQTVKVWDLDSDGEWKLTCSWRAHNGSIWRLAWAHPEFGQILATCSFDRSVCIWEEVTTTAPSAGVGVASIGIGGGGSGGRPLTTTTFEKRAHLVESALSVTGIQFAPRHVGLQLGTCSNDGYLRIYQFSDIMQISQVSLYCEAIHTKMKNCSCIAWSQSRLHPTLIAAGCSDAGATDAACKDSFQVYELQEDSRKFAKVESVVLPKPDTGVNDLQFAPSLGRSFHLLAVASQQISLYKLRLSTGGQQQQQQSGGMLLQASQSSSSLDVGSSSGSTGRYALSCIRILEYQRCQMSVWRLSWNVLGTVLASSLEDGTVRLWQGNYADQWKCLTVMTPSGDSHTASSTDLSQQQQQQQIPAQTTGVPFAKMGSIQGSHQVVWN